VKIVVLGEPSSALATGVAGRFAASGLEVVGSPDTSDDADRFEDAVRTADAGIDCSVVNRGLKARHVALLDRMLPATAPILTCCHAASATMVAAGLDHPDRVTGFALLPPWDGRATVECARALQTGEPAVPVAEAIWRSAGLEPVWVADSAGLVLPRIVACLANEAFFAVIDRTASADDIDRAMMLGTRYPRGPLAWAHVIGLDQVLATLDALAVEHGEDRYRAAPLLRRMVAAGGGRT